ncbi:MAG: hypothetical protein SF339_09630 [Blastocatellia bacterium]|nr:hypothetical protein [Blastocatellia bacterium]
MSSIILVPIHLDALYLQTETQVTEAMAEFSRLPYFDGKADVNPDIAFVSEEIASQPFQDGNLRLLPGVHLHWALPDAMTRGSQTAEGPAFPAVPNRWLVTRSRKDAAGIFQPELQWVVESDYLYPEGAGEQAGSVSIPYSPDPKKGERQPFRYLGRTMPLSAWKETFADAQYLKPLTAVASGEPAFAAFYPNCHSVFGFYDDEFKDHPPEGVRYDVAGWYGDAAADFALKFKTGATAEFRQRNNQAAPSVEDLKQMLAAQAKWDLDPAGSAEFPEQTICYARLTIAPQASWSQATASLDSGASIAVGNTGTEALSAHLASLVVRDPKAIAPGESAEKAKANLEDQLEAAQLSDHLEHYQLDIGPRFIEARHEKGFTAVSAGFLWQVTPDTLDRQADADSGQSQSQVPLPESMAHPLHVLNLSQQAYDRAMEAVESSRRQLFSDWYKYQLCSYPPEDNRDPYPNIDEVRHYIEFKGLEPLQRRLASIGRITIGRVGDKITAQIDGSAPDSLAAKLKRAIDDLQQAIALYNQDPKVVAAKTSYALKQVPAPRYWQPNEPVVLLSGSAIKRMLRHGEDGRLNEDGLLECQLLENASARLAVTSGAVVQRLNQLAPAPGAARIGFNIWTEQPWHPFLLEWEVELFPIKNDCNQHPDCGRYDPDFITGAYRLDENRVDLSLQAGKGALTRSANVYSGAAILTPQANQQLQAALEDYFQKQLLDDYCQAKEIPLPADPAAYFKSNLADILQWYKSANCGGAVSGALCNLIRAYELMTAGDFACLSQSLGGFNDALLMQKQTLQLPIADPLGFPEYQAFAERVRNVVGGSVRSAPEPLTDFNPIRAGALKLARLRLIDTFGQRLDLDCDAITTIEPLKVAGNPDLIAMPPRLAQPARFNFRWLSADDGDLEMNDHPATTPICGWIMANHLENSLMIYDNAGKALGSIQATARWEPAPGRGGLRSAGDIRNPYLNQMVETLLASGADFLSAFITATDNALENIEPENYAQHPELALLMGRPLALVRASLNLELMGLPAIHQGWEAFRHDLQRITRDANDFDHVRFPIRIGEYRQFSDGLVGYWRETRARNEENLFYAPQSDPVSHPKIKTHADDPMTVFQTVRAEPQILAMLIDPRGAVHAASGVLPCKEISLPPDQYVEGLRAMEITFLTAPILADANAIRLPLPDEPGYAWSWLQAENGTWAETSTIEKIDAAAAFASRQELKEGWLKLRES